MQLIDILKIVWPLIVLQLGFQIYALVILAKTKKTKNLTPTLWAIIIIFGEILGAALYFLIGKTEE